MKIVIKKRVSLDFLGEDFKESYLVFRAIPIRDYEAMIDQVEQFADDNKKAVKYIQQVVSDYFLEGKHQGEDISKEDLTQFDQDTYMHVFQFITGQRQAENLEPK